MGGQGKCKSLLQLKYSQFTFFKENVFLKDSKSQPYSSKLLQPDIWKFTMLFSPLSCLKLSIIESNRGEKRMSILILQCLRYNWKKYLKTCKVNKYILQQEEGFPPIPPYSLSCVCKPIPGKRTRLPSKPNLKLPQTRRPTDRHGGPRTDTHAERTLNTGSFCLCCSIERAA